MTEQKVILPKKIYRRQKKNYTEKRDNYKKYYNSNWKWNEVFNEIEKLKLENVKSYIKIVAKKYNIKYDTLKKKYSKWIHNNKPSLIVIKENRGGHNKYFSETDERLLYEYIKEVYIDNQLFFDDECLKLLAIKKWNLLNPDKKDLFKASNGWIYDFKHRWNLSSLTSKNSKKSTLSNDIDLNDFLKICKQVYQKINNSLIFNMDETFWRIVNGNLNVIGITGSKDRKVILNINNKSGFTAIFIISLDGTFLKPIIIIKGKTERCLKKTGLFDDQILFRKFTENGWIDESIMKFILCEIYKISKGNHSALILDKYSVHTNTIIKDVAHKLNINLIYVPSGKTATNQPLDVNINGPIKSIGKKIAKEMYISNPFATPTISDSIKSLIESKNRIAKETIINSFIIACHL
jgi:DDE superfamily endonuclease/Tc5 transposase-like DNA-binding protein